MVHRGEFAMHAIRCGIRRIALHVRTPDALECDSKYVQLAKSSVIVRVRGPLVRWNRSQPARCLRGGCAIADGSTGRLAFRRFLSVFAILSRRSVRRHNVIEARAFIAVHTDEIASLLP